MSCARRFCRANVVSTYSYVGTRPPQLHPTDPATYPGWGPWDAIDRAAAQTGIRLYMTITGPIPLWAAGPNPPQPLSVQTGVTWKPSAADFGQFVQAAASATAATTPPPAPRARCRGSTSGRSGTSRTTARTSNRKPWEAILCQQAYYRELVNAGWNGLHVTGHTTSTDTILIGETAPYGVEPSDARASHEMAPLAFLRGLSCVNSSYRPLQGAAAGKIGCPTSSGSFKANNPALFDAGGWADHPYTGGQAPTVVSRGIPGSADYADFGALGHLATALDRSASAYGSSVKLPIYNTEFGFRTNPPDTTPTATTPAKAARYINQAEYISWHNHRIRSYTQYELIDPPGKGGIFATGLKFNAGGTDVFAGRPKPSFYAYRMPLWIPQTHSTRRAPLKVWGCARAAPVIARHTGRPAIHPDPALELERWVPDSSYRDTPPHLDDRLLLPDGRPVPRSGTVRLAWSDSGAVQHSRLQAITIG